MNAFAWIGLAFVVGLGLFGFCWWFSSACLWLIRWIVDGGEPMEDDFSENVRASVHIQNRGR